MPVDSLADAFGRRRFLAAALATGITIAHPSRIFAAEFWNAKDPSTWTEDEINALTSKSPWTRAAVASYKGVDDPNGAASEGGRAGGPGRQTIPPNIIVRWESAQPIRDALRAPLPAEFDGHYVLSVTNLPVSIVRTSGRGVVTTPEDVIERLQNGATLEARGKGPVEAGIARRTRIGSFMFGFSRDSMRLESADRDIVFKLEVAQVSIKTKFDAKEMTYHGKLAV
jgi:hypothetical protein